MLTCFVSWHIIYLGKGFMCTWEESVFCHQSVRCVLRSLLIHSWGSLVCDELLFSFCFQDSIFIFHSFIIKGLSEVFRLNLIRDFWASYTWISISFPRFGKFSAIISLNKLANCASLCTIWGFHIVNIVLLDFVPHVLWAFILSAFYSSG